MSSSVKWVGAAGSEPAAPARARSPRSAATARGHQRALAACGKGLTGRGAAEGGAGLRRPGLAGAGAGAGVGGRGAGQTHPSSRAAADRHSSALLPSLPGSLTARQPGR